MEQVLILPAAETGVDPQWLAQQPRPVIAWGGVTAQADVVVGDEAAAQALARRIAAWPQAALVLAQVLRSSEHLPPEQGLELESLGYATLQAGGEFRAWREATTTGTPPVEVGNPIELSRSGSGIEATLNRPVSRNAMSVEMRDAWVDMLQLLALDSSVETLRIRGRGDCFSTGGELREFGQFPDAATAHWVRTVQSPARLARQLAERLTFYVHGACIGSGVELPAFGRRLVAHSRTFFQLPELQLGLIPGAGGTVSIARRIGRQRTAWLVLSGRRINARTALEWGLVDEINDFDLV